MKNKELYAYIFNLLQQDTEIMNNIDAIKELTIDYDNIDLGDLDKEDEKFYNFLLIFLRNTPDNLWVSNEHRLKVYDVIKEQLDTYHDSPNPYTKDKQYS